MSIAFFYASLFIACILYSYYFQRLSKFFNIIDLKDGKRKIHSVDTPQTGGVFIYLCIIIFTLFQIINLNFELIDFQILNDKRSNFSFFMLLSSIFLLGIYDDKYDLSAGKKMGLSSLFIFLFLNIDKSLVIENLVFSSFNYEILLGDFSIYFTLLCFLLLINAINMYDGINLQLAPYTFIVLSFYSFNFILFPFIFVILVPLIFFIYFNARGKLFLGDNGSLLCGLIIGYIIIKSYNINGFLLTDEIFLLLLLPGIDMLRVSILRIMNGRNMFSSDRNHIHHILIEKLSPVMSILILHSIVLITLFLIWIDMNRFLILLLNIFLYIFILFKKN